MKHLLKHIWCGVLLAGLILLAIAPRALAAETEVLPVSVFKNLRAGRKQTAVVYGTSLSHTAEWPKALKEYFDKNFPGQVTFINSASSGKASDWGVANFDKRVLSHNPDLVVIEFSMNDAATKHNISIEKSVANLDRMVKALRQQNPHVDIVLMTMNTVWDTPAGPGTNSASARPHLEDYYESYRKYAQERDLPLIDHYQNWLKLQQQDEQKFRKWLPDGTHPIPEASLAVTWPAIQALLEKARSMAAADRPRLCVEWSPQPATTSVQAATPSIRVAQFQGERAAAISYTFDDGLRDQYTLAVPMLNEVGFKGTFFVIAGKTAETPEAGERRRDDTNVQKLYGGISWPELKKMAEQGHEIASHTWSHLGLTKLTPEQVETEIRKAYEAIKTRIGKPPLAIAFPGNGSTPEVQAIALKYHVAYRGFQQGTKRESTAASLNGWADKLVEEKKWGVLMIHGIESGYAAMTSQEILHQHLNYAKSHEREIWVDTFANVARYVRERDSAKLTVLTNIPGVLTCSLVGCLDPISYDVPLTIVVDVPDVISVRAERGGQELPARITRGSIHIEALPDTGPIKICWK